MTNATKTFPVAAGAYRNGDHRNCLTHACEVDSYGFPAAVICGRVKLESILEDLCVATDEAPTCPACARKLARG